MHIDSLKYIRGNEQNLLNKNDNSNLFSVLSNMSQCANRMSGKFQNYSIMVDFFKRNKISFLWLNNFFDSREFYKDLFSSESFKNEYRNELNRFNSWKKDFDKIKDKWHKEKIDYIFIKSTGSFPHMSDNVDILVRQRDFKKAGKVLADMGFINLRNIQEPHKNFYRKFIDGKSSIPVHLHERVCWGVPYENNDHLWDNYVSSDDDKTIHYPSNEDALLINIAHCFLEDHLIKIYDLLAVKICLEGEIDWNYVLRTTEDMYWLHAFYTGLLILDHLYMQVFQDTLFPPQLIEKAEYYVSKKNWIRKILKERIFVEKPIFPFKIPHIWTRIHSSLRVINDPTFGCQIRRYKLLFKHLLDGLIHLKLGIKSHPKMFLAIGGVDGSGKTAHCRALQNAFLTCEIKTSYVWSRAGSLPVTKIFMEIIKFFHFGKRKGRKQSLESKKRQLPKTSFNIRLWGILNIFDSILFYFCRVYIPLMFGKVVIADRYIYDSIIDMEHLGGSRNFSRISYKILQFLTPRPDLLLFLDVNPDTVLKRGSDESLVDIENKYSLYKSIMLEQKAIFIDNSKSFGEVSEKISYATLSRFFAKYPNKYNGYNLVSLKYK